MEGDPSNNSEHLTLDEWTEKMNEGYQLVESIFDELTRIYDDEWLFHWEAIKNAQYEKISKTGVSKPELRSYGMYFVMISGSTDYQRSGTFDLAGDLSMFDYLQKTLEELKARPTPAPKTEL